MTLFDMLNKFRLNSEVKQSLNADETKIMLDKSFETLQKGSYDLVREAMNVVNELSMRLEKTSTRLNVITEQVDNAIVVETIDGVWVNANSRACETLGIDNKICTGKSNTELMGVYPHMRDLISLIIDMEHKAKETQMIESSYAAFTRGDVNMMLAVSVIPSKSETGHHSEFIIIGRDVDKENSVIKIATNADDIFNAFQESVIVVWPNFAVKYINKKSEEVFNIQREKIVENRTHLADIIGRDLAETIEYSATKTLSNTHIGISQYCIEITPVLSDPDTISYYILKFHR